MNREYNNLSDRLSAGEFLELQDALEVVLRLTVGKLDGPTRVPIEASVRFMVDQGEKLPLAATVRSLD